MRNWSRIAITTLLIISCSYLLLLIAWKRIDNEFICTGFAFCKLFHNSDRVLALNVTEHWTNLNDTQLHQYWTSGPEDSNLWSEKEISLRQIPEYVLEHAPFVHLFSKERFWPGDLAQHLAHTTPFANYTKIEDGKFLDLDLNDLDRLNEADDSLGGKFVFLNTDYDAVNPEDWLVGAENIPVVVSDKAQASGNLTEPFPEPAMKQDSLQSVMLSDSLPDATIDDPSKAHQEDEGSPLIEKLLCKSIFGHFGTSAAHCNNFCDATAGKCNDAVRMGSDPHLDLKRRDLPPPQEPQHSSSSQSGMSKAPAILIVVPKGDGVVDAFWFFFYSFNLGPGVMNTRFGHHLGDWEHTMIRFKDGKPKTVFMSAHSHGHAFAWEALEKYAFNSNQLSSSWTNYTTPDSAKRPVLFSAFGSHAMYPTPGVQPYGLPWNILHDQTDRGPLWDPSLNVRSYIYEPKHDLLRSSTLNPKAPTAWFHYAGRWGSLGMPASDPRQYSIAGQRHYKIGPTGPKFKWLGRKSPCAGKGRCSIQRLIKLERPRRTKARA